MSKKTLGLAMKAAVVREYAREAIGANAKVPREENAATAVSNMMILILILETEETKKDFIG
jgi:hypothetical protein